MITHMVKSGETLYSIAKLYNVPLQSLVSANNLANPNVLQIGQNLVIPISVTSHPTISRGTKGTAVLELQQRLISLGYSPGPADGIFGAQTETAVKAFQTSSGLIPDGIIGPKTWATLLAKEQPPGYTQYTIKPGDTLSSIAAKFGVTVGAIVAANNITNPQLIYPGQVLLIPIPGTTPTPTPTPSPTPTPTPTPAPSPTPFSYSDTTDNLAVALIDQASKNYIDGYTITDMVPLSNGWVILGDTNKNSIFVLNAITGEVLKRYQLQSAPNSIDFDFNAGIILANQAATSKIAKIDINTDAITYITTKGRNAAVTAGENNIAFSYSPDWPQGNISIIDTLQNQELGTTTIQDADIGFLAYDRINHNLFLGESGMSPSYLYRYTFDPAAKQLVFSQSTRDVGSNGEDLVVSNDGKHVAFSVGSGNGTGYTTFDIDSTDLNNNFGQWDIGAYPVSAFFSNDSKYLVATNRSEVKLFTVDTHVLLRTVVAENSIGNIQKVYFSRGDKIIYAAGTGQLVGPIIRLYFYKSGL